MIPLAYCGYSSKQQKHISLIKCYKFVIIDVKQYSNHSAYIHICTENIKKNYSILLLNCSIPAHKSPSASLLHTHHWNIKHHELSVYSDN